MLDITYGVDFTKIDKMAMDLGINIDDAKRIESAIKYSLCIASNNGNTEVVKENLIEFVKNLIGSSTENIKEAIINLHSKKDIMFEEQEDQEWIALNTFYTCEKNIAEKIVALEKANNIKNIKNFDSKFKKIEKSTNIILSSKQKEAVKLVNTNNVCIITGGPGTGKTTIIKFIIDMYKNGNDGSCHRKLIIGIIRKHSVESGSHQGICHSGFDRHTFPPSDNGSQQREPDQKGVKTHPGCLYRKTPDGKKNPVRIKTSNQYSQKKMPGQALQRRND